MMGRIIQSRSARSPSAPGARDLLTPEAQLVLLPNQRGERSAEVARLLAQPLDWELLLDLAMRERAFLPLYRSLRATGFEGTTAEFARLREAAQLWELKLFHLERLLLKTLAAFDEAGIEALVLKGAAAAFTVHDGFSDRPMYDVDLLLEEKDAEKGWRIARERGWAWESERFPWDAYRDAHHLPPLTDEGGSASGLEIHRSLWMPGHPFDLPLDAVRERSREQRREGVSIRVPAPNDQLLHCCAHFAWSHRMKSHAWRAFSDVDGFVRSGQIDWEGFVDLARSSGADTCCYWTLRLAAVAADVATPHDVLKALKPSGSDFLLNRLERHYILNLLPAGGTCPSLALEKRLWALGIRKGRKSSGIDLPSTPERAGFGARVRHQMRNLGEWAGYLRKMI